MNRRWLGISAVSGALGLALTGAALGPARADEARGVVFDDRDGNGRRDPGEPAVPGVAVSNGRDVVLTDETGAYSLDVRDGTIVFVTQPAGWTVPVDELRLPRHYYVYAPGGTPPAAGLRYRGLDPTGPLPASIDFPLRRAEQPEHFRVLWFSDTQPQTEAEIDYIRDDVVTELVGIDAAFGVTTGDLVYDDMALLPRLNAVIARIGIPWHNVPGNHELNYLAEDERLARETFKRYFGPPYYSFEYARCHFVVLDDIYYLGRDQGRQTPHPRGAGTYEGRIEGDQLEWLAHDLAHVPQDRLVVLAMHIPLRYAIDPQAPAVNVLRRERLFDILGSRRHVFLVAGHTHTVEHNYFGPEDGWPGETPLHQHTIATVAGSWWSGPFDERGIPTTWQRDGSPNGYYVMEVNGVDYTMRFHPAGRPADDQLRIVIDAAFHRFSPDGIRDYRMGQLLGGRLHVDQLHAAEVVVNLFDGGPRSRLELRVDDGEWHPLRRDTRIDPFFQELYLHHKAEIKSFVEPAPSTHIWVGPLPDDLGLGVHALEVRAVDEYGATHTGRKLFEVWGSGTD